MESIVRQHDRISKSCFLSKFDILKSMVIFAENQMAIPRAHALNLSVLFI